MIISPLKVWVQNILPVVYDDSLSYLEIVAKINAKTNEIITQTNENTHAIETLAETIAELGDIEELRALLDEIETIIDDLYTTDVPLMDGTASAGSANHAARSDHVHPSDTSRAPVNHASNETTYGIGGANNYGHVKITDDINNTDTGTGIKPSVVKGVNDKLKTFTKDNMLDNGYFVGGGSQLGNGIFPVNQRGNVTYPNAGNCIDRWKLERGSVTVQDEGLLCTSPSDNTFRIAQRIPYGVIKNLLGKPCTLSALVNDTLCEFNISSVSETSQNKNFTVDGVNIDIYAQFETTWGNVYRPILFFVEANKSAKLKAIKFELGSEQTLAHQENGQWVLNEIPDYAKELAKCQRYCIALNPVGGQYQWVGTGITWSATEADAFIPTPVTMWKNPTAEDPENWRLWLPSVVTPESVTLQRTSGGLKAVFGITNGTAGTPFLVGNGISNTKLIISADL